MEQEPLLATSFPEQKEKSNDCFYDDLMEAFFSFEINSDEYCCCEHPSFYNQSYQKEIDELKLLLESSPETFSMEVLRMIKEKSLSEKEVYKRAQLDRKLFSKLRTHLDYQPSRTTAITIALALELSIEECNLLLAKAGFYLSDTLAQDRVIRYCIAHKIYSILAINEILYSLNLPLL